MFADDAVRLTAYSYQKGDPSHIATDLNDDLDFYNPNRAYIRSEHRRRPTTFANNWNGLRDKNAFLGGVPQIAFSSLHVQRGEVLPTFAGNSVGIASYPMLSAGISSLARFMLPVGATAAAPVVGSILAVNAAYRVGLLTRQTVKYVQKWGYRLRHIEMGGDYQDTETALALRMRSVNEMSSALSYSRRWLGNEASFMR
jgi:hypothetical protein